MIPKTLFLYWGNEKLSFLRYLTVYSFRKYNKDWKIKIYIPSKLTKSNTWSTGEQVDDYVGQDYFDELKELDVEIIKFDMSTIGFSNDLPEVHKSDVLRYWLLYNYGGVYSDFDIIYFKPLNISNDINTMLCFNSLQFSVGLIGGSKGNKFYKKLFNLSKDVNDKEYQSFGNALWYGSMIPEDNVWDIPMSLIYNYDLFKMDEIFDKGVKNFPENSIGCHWYAGTLMASEWENKIMHSNYDNYDIMLCSIIKEVYNERAN